MAVGLARDLGEKAQWMDISLITALPNGRRRRSLQRVLSILADGKSPVYSEGKALPMQSTFFSQVSTILFARLTRIQVP